MFTEQRIEAVRRRLRELQVDEQAAKASGEPCVKCKHFIEKQTLCGHIALSERRFDYVAGQFEETQPVTAAVAREPAGLCGPEGLLYERKWTFHPIVRGFARFMALNFGDHKTVMAELNRPGSWSGKR